MLRVPVRWRLAAPAILIALVISGSSICYRALNARNRAAEESAAASQIPAAFQAIETHPVSTVESIASRTDFRDVATLHGRIYLCGPDGLYGYDADGTPRESYHVGRELPAGEPVAIASSASELFIATGDNPFIFGTRCQGFVVGLERAGEVTVPLSQKHAAGEFPMNTPVARIFRLNGVRYALAVSLFRCDAPAANWTAVLAPEKGALTDRNIASLNIAHDGRVWVGYFDRGLDVADAAFDSVRHFEDEHLFCINRIAEEPGGARTAVATANGLVMMDASLTVRQVLGRKDGLLADHVTDVLFRPRGMVIATPAGLSLADADGVRSLYVLHGLVNNHVYALAAAGDRIAAGTLGGLSLLDHGAVTVNYTTANSGLKHNWISALARVGDDWFAGTYGSGVMRLDGSGHWTAMTPPFEVNPNAMA